VNRRTFNQKFTSLAVGASVLGRAPVLLAGQESKPAAAASAVPFQLSVMLWTVFTGMPFEDRLAKVAEAGYTNVELTGEFRNWTDDQYASANAKRKSLGMTFDATSGVRHGIGNPADRDAMLAELTAILPVMEKLDCPSVILLSGNVVPGMSHEDQHQSCIDGLKAALPLIEGKKINGRPVKIIVENIDPEENPKYFLTSVAEGFEIIKAVDHPQVRFLYDLYHEQIAEGNLIKKLQNTLPYVAVIHIADVPGRHEPGTGEIDYQNIYRKLVELKYDGMVAMEFRPTGDPVAMLRAARAMALAAGTAT
jgi:hydroxypyruvate isomerase